MLCRDIPCSFLFIKRPTFISWKSNFLKNKINNEVFNWAFLKKISQLIFVRSIFSVKIIFLWHSVERRYKIYVVSKNYKTTNKKIWTLKWVNSKYRSSRFAELKGGSIKSRSINRYWKISYGTLYIYARMTKYRGQTHDEKMPFHFDISVSFPCIFS